MPKVTDEHRSERRSYILSAALRCFTRKGFAGTSMSDIITESKLSAGAIYGHFTNKEDLIYEAASFVLGLRLVELRVQISEGALEHPAAAIRRLVFGFERDIAQLDLILQVWSQSALDPQLRAVFNEAWREISSFIEEYISAWLRQEGTAPAVASDRSRALAPVYAAFMQGYVLQRNLIDDFNTAEFFAAIESLPLLQREDSVVEHLS